MQARSNGTKRPAMLDNEADGNKTVNIVGRSSGISWNSAGGSCPAVSSHVSLWVAFSRAGHVLHCSSVVVALSPRPLPPSKITVSFGNRWLNWVIMKTLGQYSWKQLILSWLLVEQHCPSLIKIVSAHEVPATFRAVARLGVLNWSQQRPEPCSLEEKSPCVSSTLTHSVPSVLRAPREAAGDWLNLILL